MMHAKSLAACLAPLVLTSCSDHGATPQVVQIPVTAIEDQSLGNCWTYQFEAWAEALALRGGAPQTTNFSEAYLLYRHLQMQLPHLGRGQKLEPAGAWVRAVQVTTAHGFLEEKDFTNAQGRPAPQDADGKAYDYLVNSLNSPTGKLNLSRDPRTGKPSPAMIQEELDAAFGVDHRTFGPKIRTAASISTGNRTLADELRSWKEIQFPYGTRLGDTVALPVKPLALDPAQRSVLDRVKRVLAAGLPVPMTFMVDYNGLSKPEGRFGFDILERNFRVNGPARQAFHGILLVDYAASGRDARGTAFRIPEGHASASDRDLALRFGNIEYFIAKNSWGPTRASYPYAGQAGFLRLDADYLFGYVNQKTTSGTRRPVHPMNDFFLPDHVL